MARRPYELAGFDVAEVNDAPAGHDTTIAAVEDKPVTLEAAHFGFSDPQDHPADSLLAVKIATLPDSGRLTLAGDVVTAGQVISVTDINVGKLVWTPGHDDYGDDLASLTFQVQDSGGTANGGIDLDPAPKTLTFDVAAVNDAPVARNDLYTTLEDCPLYVAAAAGVIGGDSDIDGNALSAVLVTGPAHGKLTLTANGSFTYTPTANYNGTDSFTYKANDGTADSNIATVTLTIDGINDAPVNTVPAGPQQVDDDEYYSLIFSTAKGNRIGIFDVDAGDSDMQVVLSVQHGDLLIGHAASGLIVDGDGTDKVTLTGSQTDINSALEGLKYTFNSQDDYESNCEGDDESHNDYLTITTTDLGHSGADGSLSDTDKIKIEIGDDDDSPYSRSFTSFPSLDVGGAFTGAGAGIDLMDFSTAAFANATTTASGVDAPIDADHAADLLSNFDSATQQIDLSGIMPTDADAADPQNVAELLPAMDSGSGQIVGQMSANLPEKIAGVSGTQAIDQYVMGASSGDIILAVFDQMQPAAHVGLQ